MKKTCKAEAGEWRLGAYSEIQEEVLQWGHFPVRFWWRLKYFSHLLCLIVSSLLHHLGWVLEILVLWGEEGGWLTPRLMAWSQELWSVNLYVISAQVTVPELLVCEQCIIGEAVLIWCFPKEELSVFIVSTTDFLPRSLLSNDCRPGKCALTALSPWWVCTSADSQQLFSFSESV